MSKIQFLIPNELVKRFGKSWVDLWEKDNSDTVIPPLKMHNGDYALTDIEKASALNDYFVQFYL